MEPLGWDEDERAYFVLDDDRLYRRTDAPLPPEPEPKTKAKGKNAKKTRSAKKRRISRPVIESSPDMTEEDQAATNGVAASVAEQEEDDGLGGMKWELIAITLDEYTAFLDTIRRSRDANAKALFKRITSTVLPTIEKRAEQLRQKELRKIRELENLQKMATAKRSSRLAGKAEQRKAQEEAEIAERKHQEELEMAHREQAKQQKLDEDRESRMMTREQRLKDREVRRILHEEELKKLEQDKERAESDAARLSERHLKAEMEKKRRELELLAEEDDWTFDCAKCGMHGQNIDDGSHSIACDKCGVWQHSACHGIKQDEAERDDFQFVCTPCKRKVERANQPKIPPLKLKFSSSPPSEPRQLDAANLPTQASSSNKAMPPIGRFDGAHVPARTTTNGISPGANGHAASSAARQSPYQAHPLVSAPSLTREQSSPAATANFRYSLQQGGSTSSPPPTASSPPQQSWNHHHTQEHIQNGYRSQSSQDHGYAAQHLPPMASFNPQGYHQQGALPQQALARPPSQGSPYAPSPSHAPAPAQQPAPFAVGHSQRGAPPNAHRTMASPPHPHGAQHRTPTVPQSQSLHSAMRGPSGPSTSPLGPSYLSTPQYAAPRPPPMQTPLPAASASPMKQESPRLTAPSLANSPPVVPPAMTLTPTFGNIQHHSPPTKKASPSEQRPRPLPAVMSQPHPGEANGAAQ